MRRKEFSEEWENYADKVGFLFSKLRKTEKKRMIGTVCDVSVRGS